ncbi:MAG: DegV family protein [Acidimicrobiales bacterium]
MIGICCDSGAQLSPFLAASHHIEVVPLTVTIDGVEHLETDLDPDDFWHHFADGHVPSLTTAAPSPGRIAEHHQRLIDRGATSIVSVHTGSEISGTFNAARLAAAERTVPVELVDTGSASFIVGCATLAAAEAVAAGASAADSAAAAHAVAARCGNVFIVGGLDLARAGGRLADGAGDRDAPATVPVLSLIGGEMTPVGDVESTDRAAAVMAAEILTLGGPLRVGIAIADRSSVPIATRLRTILEESRADVELLDYRVGPSVGAHTGPGTAGAVYHTR